MFTHQKSNAGEFQEVDHGRFFTYRLTNDAWATAAGYTHEIDVLDGVRFARVLKTVVHVCIDEDADGKPVQEIWKIKNHSKYTPA